MILIGIGLDLFISGGHICPNDGQNASILDICAKRHFNFTLIIGNSQDQVIVIKLPLDLLISSMVIHHRGVDIDIIL